MDTNVLYYGDNLDILRKYVTDASVASQTLGRRWVGIDITYLSVAVMRARMKDVFAFRAFP